MRVLLKYICFFGLNAILIFSYASSCFSVGDLSGVASRRGDAFKVDKDGFKDRTFQIMFNGRMSIAPDWDTPCVETAKDAMLCQKIGNGTVSTEMWAVDPESKTVLFTRMRSGFDVLDGASLFVGKVLGTCNLTPPKAPN